METPRQHIFRLLTAAAGSLGMSHRQFGLHYAHDGKFMSRVRDGGNVTIGLVERVLEDAGRDVAVANAELDQVLLANVEAWKAGPAEYDMAPIGKGG